MPAARVLGRTSDWLLELQGAKQRPYRIGSHGNATVYLLGSSRETASPI